MHQSFGEGLRAREERKGRVHEQRDRHRPSPRPLPRKSNFERVCVIKPVMADREIEACRVTYRRKDI